MRQRILVPTILSTKSYTQKIRTLFGSSIIGHWPLDDPVGSSVARDISGNGYNGTPSNVTFGVAGIGDGRTAASFNGTTSYINVYSAGLAGAFNGQEGTILTWAKVNDWTADWVDIFRLQADGDNLIVLSQPDTNNQLYVQYKAGGIVKEQWNSPAGPPSGFIHITITWSLSTDNRVVWYINGSVIDVLNTLGTWVGSLAATTTVLGAASITPTGTVSGNIAHTIILNRKATGPEVAEAASV